MTTNFTAAIKTMAKHNALSIFCRLRTAIFVVLLFIQKSLLLFAQSAPFESVRVILARHRNVSFGCSVYVWADIVRV